MARSVWKGPFVDRNVFKAVAANATKAWSRPMPIVPAFVKETQIAGLKPEMK